MKSPLALVQEKFTDKKSLVEAVEKLANEDLWVARTNKDKGLHHVSNAKLLRLHETFTAVKEKFGTRDKLIASILEVEKRAKDEGYKAGIAGYPVARLYDLYKSASKRAAARAKKPAPVAKKANEAPAKASKAKASAEPKKKAGAK